MNHDNLFSYPPGPTDNKPHQAPAEDKMAQMNDSLEQMQSDLRRNRLQIERQMIDHDTHVRRTKMLWAVAIVLLIGLAGMAWYGYPYTKERNLSAQVPALQSAVRGFGDKMASIEENLVAGAADQTTLTNRFSNLEQGIKSNLREVRNQAQAVATQMGTRIRNEMNQSITAIQNRVSGVESIQRESSEHVAKLESELAGVRQELRNVQQQSAQQLQQAQQFNQAQQVTISALSDLKQHVNSNKSRIDAVVDRINTERTDFVVSRNQTQQVAPGIYLTIKETDVAQQRVDGWMQLASEGRILWVRGNGAQNPMTFVTRKEQRAHELVFTRVGKDGVAGYVLVPTPISTASGDRASESPR